MPKVNSSAIAAIEYEPESKNMHVFFHETGQYTYYDVPEDVYLAFLNSRSVGQFFNIHIRDKYSR